MNIVIVSGNLVSDVAVKENKDGIKFGKNAIACNRKFSKKNEVDFINISFFGNNAEYLAKYGEKGAYTEVVGRLQVSSYTDKNGIKKTTTEVVVDDVKICGKKALSTEKAEEEIIVEKPVEDDDLPF